MLRNPHPKLQTLPLPIAHDCVHGVTVTDLPKLIFDGIVLQYSRRIMTVSGGKITNIGY